MTLVLPKPTIDQIVNGMIAALVAQSNGSTSFVQSSLAPFGVTLDTTTVSATETNTVDNVTKYKYIKYGNRRMPPPGLGVLFYPLTPRFGWWAAPTIQKMDISIAIVSYWDDPTGAFPAIREDEDLLTRMFVTFSQVLWKIFSPANLTSVSGATTASWDVTGAGDMLIDPKIEILTPTGWAINPKETMEQYIHYCELMFTGFVLLNNP